MTIPLWALLAFVSVVAAGVIMYAFRERGNYDVTPAFGCLLVLAIVALWVGSCVGRMLR